MAYPPEKWKWHSTGEDAPEIENLSVVKDMDPATVKFIRELPQGILDIRMKKDFRHPKDDIEIDNLLRCIFCKSFPDSVNYYLCTNKGEAHILCKMCFDDPNRSSLTCIADIPLKDKVNSNPEIDGISKVRICGMAFSSAEAPIYDVRLKYSSFQCSGALDSSKCDCNDAAATGKETKDEVISNLQRLATTDMISLGNLLSYLDGVSALNLSYASTTLNYNIRNYLSGCAGSTYWTQCCKRWYNDPQLIAVLASYDTIIGRSQLLADDIVEKERNIQFSWDYAYQAAHDVATFVRCSRIQFFSLNRLQNQIKADICLRYGDIWNLHYGFPNRVTGTSGSLAWNVMSPGDTLLKSNPETLFVFEDMVKCKRKLDIGQKKIHAAQVITVPCGGRNNQSKFEIEMEQAFSSSSGFPLLSRFLLTIDDKSLCVVPLQEGSVLFIKEFPHYPFDTASANCGQDLHMIPKIATYENYIAVWSDPYSLKVYSIHVDKDGIARMDLYSVAPNNCIRLGMLWARWSERNDNCEYVFSLGPRPLHRSENSLMISITCPIDPDYRMYQIILPRGLNVIQYGEQFQNLRQDNVEVLTTNLEFYPGIETLMPHVEDEGLCGNKSAHGLHIYWNSNILVASYDAIKWFSQDWKAMALELTDHPESVDVSLIEIIAPNLLALVSGENIFIVMINIHNINDETIHPRTVSSSSSTGTSASQSSITLNLVRRISTGFFERGLAVRQLGLDYDRGTPYIWVVVDELFIPTDVSTYKFRDKPWSFKFYRIKFFME